jgi:ABC-type sugar transport system substrate-binding protein
MKPNPSLFLGAFLSLALANVARAAWQVWTLTETRHGLRSGLPGAGATAKLSAARNEWASFQILLRSDAPIAKAFEALVAVVTVDVDAPTSKRLTFVGTNWFDLGVRQGEAMANALRGKRGKVALLGLTEQYIDQQAFAGFRSVIEKAGLIAMEPQQDRGDSGVAARVASAMIQSTPDLVGFAGFDSESGPGIGLAVKEAGKVGQIIVTCVDAEPVHLNLIREGVVTAAIGQKRELFTYLGLRVLFDLNHSPLKFTANDRKAGVFAAPDVINTGSYTVTRDNVDIFLNTA